MSEQLVQPTPIVAKPPLLAYDAPRKIRRLSRLAIVALICGSVAGPLSFVPALCILFFYYVFPLADVLGIITIILAILSIPVSAIAIFAMCVRAVRRIEADPCLRGRKYAYYGAFIALIWIGILLSPLIIATFPLSIFTIIRLFRWLERFGFQMAY